MGYTTEFFGVFKLNKKLSKADKTFLEKLSQTRRMARKVSSKYGIEGEFYVDGKGGFGQDMDETIINYNQPPKTQPGLWCQWIPTKYGKGIEWDGNEKFTNYIEWLEYLIKWLTSKGYELSGEVKFKGEDEDDFGTITVQNGVVFQRFGTRVW